MSLFNLFPGANTIAEFVALFDSANAPTGTGNLVRSAAPALTNNVNITPLGGTTGYPLLVAGFSFTEDGSTTFTATCELPAGAVINNIQFVTTVLWDDSGAVSLIIGDDDDDNGWFEATNLKATDLLVGEVLDISNAENWGGKNGAYLVAATGRKGQAAAAYSGVHMRSVSEVIFKITAANGDGSAGRSYGFVTYADPTLVAATGT